MQLSAIAVTSDSPFSLERARRIYSDLHRMVSARKLDGPLATPMLHIHVSTKLNCAGANLTVRHRDKVIGCLFREEASSKILLHSDQPETYTILFASELDYAGQTRMSVAELHNISKQALGVVHIKDLTSRLN